MDISGIKHISDQIIGHCALFAPRLNRTGFQVKANYPSQYPPPCNLRIYEMGDKFFLMGRVCEGKDIRIAIRCAPIKDRMLRFSRRKDIKYYRKKLTDRLSFHNLICVDTNCIDPIEICVLVASYLQRDDIVDPSLVCEVIDEYFNSQMTANEGIPLGLIKGINNFSVPLKSGAFKSFMEFYKKGERSKNTAKRENLSFDYENSSEGIGKGDVDCKETPHNREIFRDMKNGHDGIPRTTVYSWINSGKMKVERKGWQYDKSQGFFDEMARLNKERVEKKACSLMVRQMMAPGEKLKSIQRKVQRYRKSGLSLREIGDKIGYEPQDMTDDQFDELD